MYVQKHENEANKQKIHNEYVLEFVNERKREQIFIYMKRNHLTAFF